MFHRAEDPEPVFSELATLDLSTVVPSLAGPSRPQDRVALTDTRSGFRKTLSSGGQGEGAGASLRVATAQGDDDAPVEIADGHVVIAAITSCTNTSNPQVMLAAGLACPKGRRPRAPLQTVGEDLTGPGVARRHGLLRPGRPARAPRNAGISARRLRMYHLHREFGSPVARRLRGGARRRPVGGRGAVGESQLRGPHPPRYPPELPGVSPIGGRLRLGGHDGPRSHHRAPRFRQRPANPSTCATCGRHQPRYRPRSNRL